MVNVPSVAQQTGQETYQDYAVKMAIKYGLDSDIFLSMLKRENNLQHTDKNGAVAIGSAGEIGIGQLKPGTAAEMGVNAFNAYENIEGAAKYLKQQLTATGNYHSALAAYNQGLAGSRGAGRQKGLQYADAVLQSVADENPAPKSWFDRFTTRVDEGGIFNGIVQNGGIIIAGVAILLVALVMTGRNAATETLKGVIKS